MQVFQPILEAARDDGFILRLEGAGARLEGSVIVRGKSVPLILRFEDLTLAEGPRAFLTDISMLGRKVVPHVDDALELCVVDRSVFVFDREKAPELVRGLIARAAEVLERGMTKAGTDEIADEFPSYWSSTYIPDIASEGEADGAAAKTEAANVAEVTTASRLSFEAHQAKPETWGAFVEWAAFWDPGLDDRLTNALAGLSAKNPTVVIRAPNAAIAVAVTVPKASSKSQGAFDKGAGRRRLLRTPAARAFKIERLRVRAMDLVAILGANGVDGIPPLSSKKIVVVGCGAIGGYLARMLVQMGAGIGGGRLNLIDADRLDATNIRRHQLGREAYARHKVVACAEMLGRDFPGVVVKPFVGEAHQNPSLLFDADLVIDATGEQGFSEWLNAWWISRARADEVRPDLLFCWVAGPGAAVQSFMMTKATGDDFACYRCLQPDLRERGRFDPLKEAPADPVQPCGEAAFTPYGPAAPTIAAGLAVSHAGDWALGHPHPLMRTVRIDWEATVKRDPKSPDRARNCPACIAA